MKILVNNSGHRKMKIKKGDNVMVISGKDRGKTGLIERVLPKDDKVLVAGVNLNKRHLKPSQKNPHGGITTITAPISASNVQVVCPHCGQTTKVAHRVSPQMKERICRKCQGNLDTAAATKASSVVKKAESKPNSSAKLGVKEKNVKS